MTCNDCIHIAVCYRRVGMTSDRYAEKCGDFKDDVVKNIKTKMLHKIEINKEYSTSFYMDGLRDGLAIIDEYER